MSGRDELALEHAWRYFALHSEQRTTVFNFFAAAAGLTLTGLAYVLGTKNTPAQFGLAAGIAAVILSLVFWKLDQRVAQLTKCAEQVIVQLEGVALPESHRVFSLADALPVNQSRFPFRGTWSYGRSFRILFAGVAALGLSGAVMNSYALLKGSAGVHVAAAASRHEKEALDTQSTAPRQVASVVKQSKIDAKHVKSSAPQPEIRSAEDCRQHASSGTDRSSARIASCT